MYLSTQATTTQAKEKVANEYLSHSYTSIHILPLNQYGRFDDRSRVYLQRFIDAYKPMTVVELKSGLGLSTSYIASLLPQGARLYAIDSWQRHEDYTVRFPEAIPILPSFYQQFLSNVIHQKQTHTIIPIRMESRESASLTIKPELIYINAIESAEPIADDLMWYFALPSKGIMCGNNWEDPAVQQAITTFVHTVRTLVHFDGSFWYLDPKP